ncbi:Uncharacterised protein [Candidatus Bilamarchaeum dharawalense]|uniref:Uncharacterized protein n=1 Tax=Candidatus Bilamarchaeum dharawalense TaxID=2885759 RepID=A0A5E4LW31_9ARCH|nr:Uncharacterised protein [Candidatus Bilamarchaeum dharawalense]
MLKTYNTTNSHLKILWINKNSMNGRDNDAKGRKTVLMYDLTAGTRTPETGILSTGDRSRVTLAIAVPATLAEYLRGIPPINEKTPGMIATDLVRGIMAWSREAGLKGMDGKRVALRELQCSIVEQLDLDAATKTELKEGFAAALVISRALYDAKVSGHVSPDDAIKIFKYARNQIERHGEMLEDGMGRRVDLAELSRVFESEARRFTVNHRALELVVCQDGQHPEYQTKVPIMEPVTQGDLTMLLLNQANDINRNVRRHLLGHEYGKYNLITASVSEELARSRAGGAVA